MNQPIGATTEPAMASSSTSPSTARPSGRPTGRSMTRKQRRLAMIASAGAVLAVALGLVLYAMSDTIVFFHAPSDIAAKGVQPGARIRLGGLVKEGSIRRSEGQNVAFDVHDGGAVVPVQFQGILPDLFREGQGVVAEGVLEPAGTFKADTVLARHDETYMPREVADALRKQGRWQGDEPPPKAMAKE